MGRALAEEGEAWPRPGLPKGLAELPAAQFLGGLGVWTPWMMLVWSALPGHALFP